MGHVGTKNILGTKNSISKSVLKISRQSSLVVAMDMYVIQICWLQWTETQPELAWAKVKEKN